MSNIAQVLKAEIVRLAKKESKAQLKFIKADVVKLKKSAAALKKVVKALQKDNLFLIAAENKRQLNAPVIAPENADKARVTAKGVKALRRKLGLTQGEFARLVGVSVMSVAAWASKSGPLKVRDNTRAAIISLRELTKKDVARKLELLPLKTAKPAKVVKVAKKVRRGRKAKK